MHTHARPQLHYHVICRELPGLVDVLFDPRPELSRCIALLKNRMGTPNRNSISCQHGRYRDAGTVNLIARNKSYLATRISGEKSELGIKA